MPTSVPVASFIHVSLCGELRRTFMPPFMGLIYEACVGTEAGRCVSMGRAQRYPDPLRATQQGLLVCVRDMVLPDENIGLSS